MLSALKRLTKHSIVYGISNILGKTINFLLIPLYTNYLEKSEYGEFAIIYAYIAIANIIFIYGLDSAFLRFYLMEGDNEKRKTIFSTTYISLFLSSLIFTILLIFFSNQFSNFIFHSEDKKNFILFAVGILFFDTLSAISFILLRALEKSILFASIKLVNIGINIALNIVLIIVFKMNVEGILISNLIASIFSFVIFIPMIIKNINWKFDKIIYTELLKFGIPYLPSGFAIIILEVMDRIILESFTDKATVGVYSNGHALGRLMSLYVGVFLFAWQPFFLQIYRQEDARKIFSRVTTYFIFTTCLLFLFLTFFIDDIIRIKIGNGYIIGDKFWEGTQVVPIIAGAYLFYGIYICLMPGINIEKKTHILPFITGTGAVINIMSNFLLISFFGMMGSAYSSLIAYVFMAIALYFYIQKYYYIEYELIRLLKLFIAVILLLVIYKIFVLTVLLKVLFFISFPVILFVFGFFKRGELTWILQVTNFLPRKHQN